MKALTLIALICGSLLYSACSTTDITWKPLYDSPRMVRAVTPSQFRAFRQAVRRLAHDSRRRMTQPADGQPSKPDDLTIVAFRPGRGGHGTRARRASLP